MYNLLLLPENMVRVPRKVFNWVLMFTIPPAVTFYFCQPEPDAIRHQKLVFLISNSCHSHPVLTIPKEELYGREIRANRAQNKQIQAMLSRGSQPDVGKKVDELLKAGKSRNSHQ
jgi:hypothetical protein